MLNIDLETAQTLVNSINPNMKEPMLTLELEATKGKTYRPYFVAAKGFLMDYRRIIRADEVTFQYNDDAIRGLLNVQKQHDGDDDTIPDGQSTDDLLNELCNTCENMNGGLGGEIGVNIY